jgi:uncharacterized protein YfaS (alpha-2-macroglobulin family)
VANNVEGSGPDAEIELRVETSEHLALADAAVQKLKVAEGRERTAVYRFRTNDKLGSAEIRFIARGGNIETRRRATMSVRPPLPFMVDVHSGSFTTTSQEMAVERPMYPEFRKLQASVSALPLGLAHGLDAYLKDFPHGCSEQITSGAFCRLLLVDEVDFGLTRAEVNAQLDKTFGTLRRRQNDRGGFGYWAPEEGDQISFISAYVVDFLAQAKAAGFPPPAEMFALGLRNLQRVVAREPSDKGEARTIAYAIYLLTREGVITTNYILNLRDYLDKHQEDRWQTELTGVYLAGALKLLHQDAEADKLIARYRLDPKRITERDDFCQPLGADSQFIAILARHFPVRLRKISAEQFGEMMKPIAQGNFNTLSAAYAVAALKSYSHLLAQNIPELSIAEVRGKQPENRLAHGHKLLQRTEFSAGATALRFRTSSAIGGPGIYYQVLEAGFDKRTPDQPIANGLEIYRELLDKYGAPVTRTHLGESVRVRLHVRSLQGEPVTNVAIIDLLPGGFEVVGSSLRPGVSSIRNTDYVDVREDRAIFFGTALPSAREIEYEIKSCNRGEFIVPPVFAESMYERNVKGRGLGGRITVTE